MNKTNSLPPKNNFKNKYFNIFYIYRAALKNYEINKNTNRTIIHETNPSSFIFHDDTKHIKKNNYKVSSASGSINNLIQTTPVNETKSKSLLV